MLSKFSLSVKRNILFSECGGPVCLPVSSVRHSTLMIIFRCDYLCLTSLTILMFKRLFLSPVKRVKQNLSTYLVAVS